MARVNIGSVQDLPIKDNLQPSEKFRQGDELEKGDQSVSWSP